MYQIAELEALAQQSDSEMMALQASLEQATKQPVRSGTWEGEGFHNSAKAGGGEGADAGGLRLSYEAASKEQNMRR